MDEITTALDSGASETTAGGMTVARASAIRRRLDAAILRIQAVAPKLIKDQTNEYARYKYPDIDQYYAVIVPLAAAEGIRWMINTVDERPSPLEKAELVVDVVVDVSFHGHLFPAFSRFILPHAAMGAQMGGSLVSYADKIFMRNLFKLVTGEGDADRWDNGRGPHAGDARGNTSTYGAATYGAPTYGAATYGAPTYGAPTHSAPTYGARPAPRPALGVGPLAPVPPAEPPPADWEPDPYGELTALVAASGRPAPAPRPPLAAAPSVGPHGGPTAAATAALVAEITAALPFKQTLDELIYYWDSLRSQIAPLERTDPPTYRLICEKFARRKTQVKQLAPATVAKPFVRRDYRAAAVHFPRQASPPRKPPGWNGGPAR